MKIQPGLPYFDNAHHQNIVRCGRLYCEQRHASYLRLAGMVKELLGKCWLKQGRKWYCSQRCANNPKVYDLEPHPAGAIRPPIE